MDLADALIKLKYWGDAKRNHSGIWEQVCPAMLRVVEHFEGQQKEQPQLSQVKSVLTFADSLDEWAVSLRQLVYHTTESQKDEMAGRVEEFAAALRKCVEPVQEERQQQFKATMYVWNGGHNNALYDDDHRVWLGGLITIADVMRALGWDFERIEIDRDDLCGKPPPNSLKDMQEHLACVERHKAMNRVAVLRKELAALEKQLEGSK